METYQDKAMTTFLASRKNAVYAINGLAAKVGAIQDKVAKWVSKGILRIDNNLLVWNTTDEDVVAEYKRELALQLGNIRWFCSLLALVLGYTDAEVERMHLEEARDRAMRGVIDGNGDKR